MKASKHLDRCQTDHYDWKEDFCPECGAEVDQHGNTEETFVNCCFPDCGCDKVAGCPMGGRQKW